jgi:hypothetical protein
MLQLYKIPRKKKGTKIKGRKVSHLIRLTIPNFIGTQGIIRMPRIQGKRIFAKSFAKLAIMLISSPVISDPELF